MNIVNPLKRFFVLYCAMLFSSVLLLVGMITTLSPYFYDMVQRMRGIQPLCGCEQYAIFPSSFGGQLLLAILVLAVLMSSYILVRFSLTAIRTWRYRNSLLQERLHTTNYQGVPIHLVQYTEPIAVCIGAFTPEVFVSRSLVEQLSGFELLAVLQHELAHAKRYDPLQRLILSVLPHWLPVWSREVQYYYDAQEVLADQAVLDTKSIRSAFVKLIEQQQLSRVMVTATWFSAAQARVDYWLGKRPTLPAVRGLVITVMVLFSLLISTYQTFAAEPVAQAYGQCVAVQTMCESVMSYVVQ